MKKIESLQLVSVNEACKTLSISRPTFYRMVQRREISLIKIGRKSLISVSEIKVYIKKLKERG